ncbi:hypothetical protein [Maridesulfovibrio hydrothermalis]|uniref:Uncharacterized protein n=1 Tax=Maridesulfovibrio hydrothermalis AM13 = DSM 14728 TaxID=1121451 RepID=L0R9A1_9BACT|nr:hypothetical protein [Maridesulfovibrio hydrothermalis]CCO22161.1 conserved protein of unknown function [Maridesulfovibrio hydrothermalis AM13 = DSM 14728]
MGNVLQIRVMAQTYDESEVEKKWPFLVKTAWEEPQTKGRAHGVLELAADLKDRLELGMIPDEKAEAMSESIRKVYELKLRLETALGDWKASEANTISYDLEEELSVAEKIAAQRKYR